MRPKTLGELASCIGGKLIGASPETPFDGFSLDSRQVTAESVFLAIRGANSDGHDFLEGAIQCGAVCAVVERTVNGPHIQVDNLVKALATGAEKVRDSFHGPVIGITGSYGKTSVKELVSAAMSPAGKVVKTTGNRNTEYTAPLLWLELEDGAAAVVVEMGMRGLGQIAHLCSFSKPTVGIITAIGHAHLELLGTRENIARAKAELFEALPSDGTAIAWAEDDFLPALRQSSRAPLMTFGENSGDARLTHYEPIGWDRCSASAMILGEKVHFDLPVLGRHMAVNAGCALLAASRGFGWGAEELQVAASALNQAEIPGYRMQAIQFQGATILMDAYNATPGSFAAALQALREGQVSGRRLVVMGEMKELGDFSAQAHADVGRSMATSKVDQALFFGSGARPGYEVAMQIGVTANFTESIDDVREFVEQLKPGDVLLIKGSRAMELERALSGVAESSVNK